MATDGGISSFGGTRATAMSSSRPDGRRDQAARAVTRDDARVFPPHFPRPGVHESATLAPRGHGRVPAKCPGVERSREHAALVRAAGRRERVRLFRGRRLGPAARAVWVQTLRICRWSAKPGERTPGGTRVLVKTQRTSTGSPIAGTRRRPMPPSSRRKVRRRRSRFWRMADSANQTWRFPARGMHRVSHRRGGYVLGFSTRHLNGSMRSRRHGQHRRVSPRRPGTLRLPRRLPPPCLHSRRQRIARSRRKPRAGPTSTPTARIATSGAAAPGTWDARASTPFARRNHQRPRPGFGWRSGKPGPRPGEPGRRNCISG